MQKSTHDVSGPETNIPSLATYISGLETLLGRKGKKILQLNPNVSNRQKRHVNERINEHYREP
jgi:hypothetical protein